MDNLRVDIPMRFDFLFAATHAEVISGRQEGVYLWIAINHALGKFDHTLGGRNHSMCGLCYSFTNTPDKVNVLFNIGCSINNMFFH